mmetsp:Transcript_18409/g.51132  ORF Transcript_18409/g.51132 Transcript_18409/m.51132 type:complete len:83 (+) Transcript_18409:364-612(+)
MFRREPSAPPKESPWGLGLLLPSAFADDHFVISLMYIREHPHRGEKTRNKQHHHRRKNHVRPTLLCVQSNHQAVAHARLSSS